MGEGGHNTARDIAEHLCFAVDRLAGEAAPYVAVDRVRYVRARTVGNEPYSRYEDLRLAQGRSCVSRRITEFGGEDDLGQLLPHVGRLVDVIHLGGKGCSSKDYVADGRLAAGV